MVDKLSGALWLDKCISPVLMNFPLLRISGKALLEHRLKTRPAYQDYIARTSGFIPWLPKKDRGKKA